MRGSPEPLAPGQSATACPSARTASPGPSSTHRRPTPARRHRRRRHRRARFTPDPQRTLARRDQHPRQGRPPPRHRLHHAPRSASTLAGNPPRHQRTAWATSRSRVSSASRPAPPASSTTSPASIRAPSTAARVRHCASTSRAIAMRPAVAGQVSTPIPAPPSPPRPRPVEPQVVVRRVLGHVTAPPQEIAQRIPPHAQHRPQPDHPVTDRAAIPASPSTPTHAPAASAPFPPDRRPLPSATAPIPCATAQSRSAAAAPAVPRPSGCRADPSLPNAAPHADPSGAHCAATAAASPPRPRATVVHRHRHDPPRHQVVQQTAAARPNPAADTATASRSGPDPRPAPPLPPDHPSPPDTAPLPPAPQLRIACVQQ